MAPILFIFLMIFKYRIQQNLFHINFISGWKRETVMDTESQGTVEKSVRQFRWCLYFFLRIRYIVLKFSNWILSKYFRDNSTSMPDFLSIHELQNISYPALEKQEQLLRSKIRELNDELVTLLVSRQSSKSRLINIF